MLIYFLKGSLPWQGLKANSKQGKYKLILEKKLNLSVESLCMGIPKEFATFLKYTRDLGFEAEPDYQMCRNMFKKLYDAQHYTNTEPNSRPYWDWDEIDDDEDDEDEDDEDMEFEGDEDEKDKSSEESGKVFDGIGNDDNNDDNDKKRKNPTTTSNEKLITSSTMDVVNQDQSQNNAGNNPMSVFKMGNNP